MKSHILHKSICPDGMKPQLKCLFLQLAFVLLAMLVSSCNDRKEYQLSFEKAKSMIDHAPDSSLSIIDALLRHRDELSTKLQMQCRLYRLSAENKLDTVFRSADEAEHLVAYFDRKGTPNEQMLAYYLLARAYADMGEAPAALEHFKFATEKADTTSKDCDYRQLSRIYGQMANLFDCQFLLDEELVATDMSIKYALMAGDTLGALMFYSSKMFNYWKKNKLDSVIIVQDSAYHALTLYGAPKVAASYLGNSIHILASKGKVAEARNNMHIYETQSGFFDADGNIEKGREVYYYDKGMFYLAVNKLDSAEYFFRKELREGHDMNNQVAGTRGLSLLFNKRHLPDSTAKYALLSYELNDSAYALMSTEKVKQTEAMYDYRRNQQKAQDEERKAQLASLRFWVLLLVLILVILIFSLYVYQLLKRRRDVRKRFLAMLSKQSDLLSEIDYLSKSKADNEYLIEKKENELERLRNELSAFQGIRDTTVPVADKQLFDHPSHQMLMRHAVQGSSLSDEEWLQLESLIDKELPGFRDFLQKNRHLLNQREYQTCILLRLHVETKVISRMIGVSASYITKIRVKMLRDIFHLEGKAAVFDELVMNIC